MSNLGISDLTGIEAFTSIFQLICDNNQLTSLDVSNNTALFLVDCSFNQLTSLDVTSNSLTTLKCHNNLLTSLNANVPSISTLWCQNNLLTSLDISNVNWNYVDCSNNQLTSLSVGTGNMLNFEGFDARINNLTCINVDDVGYSTATWTNIDNLVSFSLNCLACIVGIPDANFKTYLVGNPLINVNGDGEIQCSEAYAFTGTISAGNLSIANLKGIEAFVNLTKLYFHNNQLESVDLTQNVELTHLYCYANLLEDIDITQNTKLTTVWCAFNQLSSLNLTQNTLLEDLRCRDNQLTNLDVSLNTSLAFLRCSINSLTSLNVANGNNTNFTLFDATNNPNLACIEVDNTNYSYTNWNLIDATSSFSTNCNVNSTYVPDNNFEQALINLGYDTVLDSEVITANISSVTNLDVSNKSISDLTGIEDFNSLQILNCNDNSLISFDITQNTALTVLRCTNNNLTNLDITQNTALTNLRCSENNLTSLDISQNINLGILNFSQNYLTSLDITQNMALHTLVFTDNQLTSLDVTQHTQLATLSFNNNNIIGLDVSQNPLLEELYCNSNQLAYLNLKNGTNGDMSVFTATDNPNLTCIEVDDVTFSTTSWTDIDAQTSFSINCNAINIGITTYFQGAYINPVLGEEIWMRDNLRVASLIPTTSPYADALTCDASIFTPTGANAIVDWVWIELRDKNDNTNILISQSALLQRDGDVVAVDGTSPISFALSDDDYFVSVSHRNHLGIVSANTVALSASTATLNLSDDITKVNGGSNAVVDLGNGIFALYSGDFDGNGQIQNTDLTSVTPLLGQPTNYSNADLDMNTQVQNTDTNNLLNPNKGKGQQARSQDLKLYAKRKNKN
ncbi:MAG: hypothetical protein L3J14_05415 [Flavobacteriaceae bacterium]|nr:hypothetical protein [Flavobacteriaceae bacterium]